MKAMNKIIVSSSVFLSVLKTLNTNEKEITIDAKNGIIQFDYIAQLSIEQKKDFIVPFYRKSIVNLIYILSKVGDQPITIQFEDSELFNVKICELYV